MFAKVLIKCKRFVWMGVVVRRIACQFTTHLHDKYSITGNKFSMTTVMMHLPNQRSWKSSPNQENGNDLRTSNTKIVLVFGLKFNYGPSATIFSAVGVRFHLVDAYEFIAIYDCMQWVAHKRYSFVYHIEDIIQWDCGGLADALFLFIVSHVILIKYPSFFYELKFSMTQKVEAKWRKKSK